MADFVNSKAFIDNSICGRVMHSVQHSLHDISLVWLNLEIVSYFFIDFTIFHGFPTAAVLLTEPDWGHWGLSISNQLQTFFLRDRFIMSCQFPEIEIYCCINHSIFSLWPQGWTFNHVPWLKSASDHVVKWRRQFNKFSSCSQGDLFASSHRRKKDSMFNVWKGRSRKKKAQKNGQYIKCQKRLLDTSSVFKKLILRA